MIAHGTKPATSFNIGIGQLGGLGDWFAIGISFGITIAAVIYALGRVSGAHINPAVTIALWATKRFPSGDAVAYIIAQCIGGCDREPALLLNRWGWMQSRSAGSGRPHRFRGSGTGRQSLSKQ